MWFLERWLENPEIVKKMVYLLYVSLIISFAFEQIPVFSAVYGFVCCILIIILSKAFGHSGIMVEEDYYDK
jgi:hypothetical protein